MSKLAIIATGAQMTIPGGGTLALSDLIENTISEKASLEDYIVNGDYKPSDRPEAGVLKRPSIIEVLEDGVTLKDILDLVQTKSGAVLYDAFGLGLMIKDAPDFLLANIPDKGKKLIGLDENLNEFSDSEDSAAADAGWTMGWFELDDEKKIGNIVFNWSYLTQKSFKPGTRIAFYHD